MIIDRSVENAELRGTITVLMYEMDNGSNNRLFHSFSSQPWYSTTRMM
jgi:hypothetical protein